MPWYSPLLDQDEENFELGLGPRPIPSDKEPVPGYDGPPDWFELVDSSEEIYLELIAIDLDEEQKIVSFVNRFGLLGVRRYLYREFEGLGYAFQPVTRQLQKHWSPEVQRAFKSARESGQQALEPDGETLAEFRFGARWTQDLVTAWRILKEKRPIEEARWQSTWWSRSHHSYGSAEVRRPSGIAEVADFLKWGLEPGLWPFRPQMLIGSAPTRSPIDEDAWLDEKGRVRLVLSFGYPSLFSVLCLELFNHILEEAPYLNCNRCGRTFVRQRGRAEYGHHRLKGVLYCSWDCSNAQAQKNYRLRRAAQRRKKGDAKSR